jgi:hypothetical protein
MSPSGYQGTQCVHQDFSSCRRHGYVPAKRIHVRIPGHTGRILVSYLHDIFQPRHSSFVAMTQLENHISQPCLTVSIYKTFKLSFATLINSSRWEYSIFYFVDNVVEAHFWWNTTDCTKTIWAPTGSLFISFSSAPFYRLPSIGCATALPMGVAPEAIAEFCRV